MTSRSDILWYDYQYTNRKGGENRMKKTLSNKALAKEAALWERMKSAVRDNPGTVCRK